MKVRDIMTTDVETASPDTSLEEIATMMKNEDVGAIPIVDGDELTGIITDRDIVIRCIAEGNDPGETDADEIISEELVTVEPEDDVEDAAQLMANRQVRRLPVVEDGRLIGMVSLGDIAVKEDEDSAGDALEDISEGVKTSSRNTSEGRGRRQPALAESGKVLAGRRGLADESNADTGRSGSRAEPGARGRQAESARGRNQGTATSRGSAGSRNVQSISNRASGDEIERQQRVNPQRAAAGSSGRKRRRTG